MNIEQKNLSRAFPKTPSFIVEMVQDRVQEQNNRKFEQKWTRYGFRVATLVLIFCCFAGTTAYAVRWLWKLHMESDGKYGVNFQLEGASKAIEEKWYTFQGDYLPANMEWRDIGTSKISINDAKGDDIIATIAFAKMENGKEWQEKFVMEYETQIINNHQAVFIEKESGSFYYVLFEEEQLLMKFEMRGVSKEEAECIIEHISLAETQEENAWNRVWLFDSDVLLDVPWTVKPEEAWMYAEHDFTSYRCSKEEMKHLHTIGETIQVTGLVDAKVINVEVFDSKDMLPTDGKYYRYNSTDSEFDSQGKIRNTLLQYVKMGDGVNSLNEVVYEAEIPMKLVSIEVEYMNTTEWELEEIKIYNRIVVAKENEEGYQLKNWEREEIDYSGYHSTLYDMEYEVSLDYYGGEGWEKENVIPRLAVGESKTVCWIYAIAEEDLPYLYLDLAYYGDYYNLKGLNRIALEKGLIDIRQEVK